MLFDVKEDALVFAAPFLLLHLFSRSSQNKTSWFGMMKWSCEIWNEGSRVFDRSPAGFPSLPLAPLSCLQANDKLWAREAADDHPQLIASRGSSDCVCAVNSQHFNQRATDWKWNVSVAGPGAHQAGTCPAVQKDAMSGVTMWLYSRDGIQPQIAALVSGCKRNHHHESRVSGNSAHRIC